MNQDRFDDCELWTIWLTQSHFAIFKIMSEWVERQTFDMRGQFALEYQIVNNCMRESAFFFLLVWHFSVNWRSEINRLAFDLHTRQFRSNQNGRPFQYILQIVDATHSSASHKQFIDFIISNRIEIHVRIYAPNSDLTPSYEVMNKLVISHTTHIDIVSFYSRR